MHFITSFRHAQRVARRHNGTYITDGLVQLEPTRENLVSFVSVLQTLPKSEPFGSLDAGSEAMHQFIPVETSDENNNAERKED